MPKRTSKKDTHEHEDLPVVENHEEVPVEKLDSEENHGSFVKKELTEDTHEVQNEEVLHEEIIEKKKPKKKIKHVKQKEKNEAEVFAIAPKKETGERERVIGEQLAQIYENSDGSMPDMKTFETRSKSRLMRAFVIFLISCVFFAVAAWVGLFVLQPRSQFSEEDVVLAISGDDTIVPGDEVTYRIRYRNSQSIALNNVILEVRYPEGFAFTTSTVASTDQKGDRWEIQHLDPGSGAYIDVTGRFFGNLGDKQSIRAFLAYKPENFTSTFQAVATKTIETSGESVHIEVALADEAARNLDTPITITITPKEGKTLEHVALVCMTKEFIVGKKSTPPYDADVPCVWTFDRIDTPIVITFSGSFTGGNTSQDFSAELRGWSSKEREGDGYVLAKASRSVALVDATTNVSLVVNGGSGDTTIAPGEMIAGSIVVQNKGETPLTDVVVEALFDAPSYNNRSILGWQELEVTGDADVAGNQLTPDTRRGKVTWDKRYIPELASIAPGKQVQIDISIPVRGGDEITLANFTTNNIAVGANFTHGKADARTTVSSNQINLSLVSDFALKVNHEFASNGGAAGIYDISWVISNSFHPLKNIRLEADFYGDVSLDQSKISAAGGSATYDTKNKRLVWTIPEMPISVDVLTLEFQVVLNSDNPTQKDLTSKVKMSAEDGITGTSIKKMGDEIQIH